jgi:hypothetical protein
MKLNKNKLKVWLGLTALAGLVLMGYVSLRYVRQLEEKVLYAEKTLALSGDLYSSLQERHDALLDSLEFNQNLVDSLMVIIDEKDERVSYLNDELERLAEEFFAREPDSVYNETKEFYFNPNDTVDVFRFTRSEMMGVSYDAFRSYKLDTIVAEQDTIIENQEKQLTIRQRMIEDLRKDGEADKELIEEYIRDLNKEILKNSELELENEKLKKAIWLWRGGALSGTALLVLLIILI